MMIILSVDNQSLMNFVLLGIFVFFACGILKRFRQPYIIAYILAGVFAGDSGVQLLADKEIVNIIGEFGLILLLFFIGMEISLPNLIKNWKIPTYGTLLQILGSVLMVGLIGWANNWSSQRIIILGFIISLSSSAVVIKLLQDNNEIETKIGQSVISILLIQDILIVPLLIISNYLGGNVPSLDEILLQIIGGVLIIGSIVWILRKKEFSLPFSKNLEDDHEMQVFYALIVCFGFALFTAFFGLSPALGAFVGGMVVHATRSTDWIHEVLHSFRVIFVAIFFISIGMMIDISFLVTNRNIIFITLFAVYIGNHFINAMVIHYFGRNWKESFYGGALLAQVGELSFVLASSAFYSTIISDFEYQLTIIVISLTLLISPFWIAATKKILKMN